MSCSHLEILAGSHIDSACEEAVELARKRGCDVTFDFNEIGLKATPTSDPKELSKQYDSETERRREEYRNSQEGKKAALDRQNDIRNKQLLVDTSIAILPARLGQKNLDLIMDWLTEFTSPADDIGVKFDHSLVADLFEAHGYKENEGVGEDRAWFNTRERMGRYIVGQAINCLRSGMAPHGITYSFIEKYRALPAQAESDSVSLSPADITYGG